MTLLSAWIVLPPSLGSYSCLW